MRELAELRVTEQFAPMLFAENEGKRLGDSIRKVQIETGDHRFPRVGQLQRQLRATLGKSFFHGWQILRQYTSDEVARARCFQLTVSRVFEPAGEECGTKYDDSVACPKCGAGATQISNLILDLRKVPRKSNIARTIADEVVISQSLAGRMSDAGLTGFELRPVRHKARYDLDPLDFNDVPSGRKILQMADLAGAPHPTGKFWTWMNRSENRQMLEQADMEFAAMKTEEVRYKQKSYPKWYQLLIISASANIAASTRAGVDPFDDDVLGEYRCPFGHVIGLNLLSEIFIDARSRGEADIVFSQQFVGVRRGLLRPRRVMLISPKFRRLIEAEATKDAKFEIAHLV